jgi:uncharacterized protein YuzE
MKITFDQEVDAMYIQLSDGKVLDSDAVEPDVVYDYGTDEDIVGIELLRVTPNLPKLATLELPFQDSQQHAEFIDFLNSIPRQRESIPQP